MDALRNRSGNIPEHKRGKPETKWGSFPGWSSSWSGILRLSVSSFNLLRRRRGASQLHCNLQRSIAFRATKIRMQAHLIVQNKRWFPKWSQITKHKIEKCLNEHKNCIWCSKIANFFLPHIHTHSGWKYMAAMFFGMVVMIQGLITMFWMIHTMIKVWSRCCPRFFSKKWIVC